MAHIKGSSVVAQDVMIARGVLQVRVIEPIPPFSDITIGGLLIRNGHVDANCKSILGYDILMSTPPLLGSTLLFNGSSWDVDVARLTGDVSGQVTENKITSLQGIPIDFTCLVPDSILYYNGSSWTSSNSLPKLDLAKTVFYGLGTAIANSGPGSITFGDSAATGGGNAIAIGAGAQASMEESIALGHNVRTIQRGSFNVKHRTGVAGDIAISGLPLWSGNELLEAVRYYCELTITADCVLEPNEIVNEWTVVRDIYNMYSSGSVNIPASGLYSIQYVVGFEDLILYLNGSPILGYLPHMIRYLSRNDILNVRTRDAVTVSGGNRHLYGFIIVRLG